MFQFFGVAGIPTQKHNLFSDNSLSIKTFNNDHAFQLLNCIAVTSLPFSVFVSLFFLYFLKYIYLFECAKS